MGSPTADVAVPRFVVRAAAPMRICDLGGWTDTWFAGHGAVFNIAVSPLVEVEMEVFAAGEAPGRITLQIANFGERYAFEPGRGPGRHPLLEAVVEEIGLPEDVSVIVRIASQVPPGSSTGTSAATAVALIGALDALAPGQLNPGQIADAAHRIEVDRLGLQSGVQDQVCAAFGGVNFMEIDPYPAVSVAPLALREPVWAELERRLLLLYLGSAHSSSDMHDKVIARLVEEGQDSTTLEHLRRCAQGARDAVLEGDLELLGRLMTENTEAQSHLHEDIVNAEAGAAMEVAAAWGAAGWKLNGAGGEGGSLTILGGRDEQLRRGLEDALLQADPRFRLIPIRLNRPGLTVRVGPY